MNRPFVLFGVWVLVLAAAPFYADNYIVRLATFVCMYSALALSWNFIGGMAGYPSFATAAFMGLGAYAGALSQKHGLPLPLAWAFATVFVAAFAALLGWAILRMRGHYFAIGSISMVEVLRLVISSWEKFTGGGDGLNVTLVAGGPDFVARLFLWVMLGIMLLVFAVTIAVDRGRLGFGLRCIQQNEDAANMVGVDTTAYKIAGFTLSAMFCGTVGAVYASWVAYIDPTDSFSILLTLKVPVMALLGGAGTVFGPVVGAAAFVIMEEFIWARFLQYHHAILGLVIVFLIFFLPGGLLRVDYGKLVARLGKKGRTA